MTDIPDGGYSFMDNPEVLRGIFHPRPEYGPIERAANASDVLIAVENRIAVAGRFHMTDPSAPNILFFHGNGEIVGDYDELGPVYNHLGINFLVVDYRGYGRSTGTPTVSNMMEDCRAVFEFTKGWLGDHGYGGAFIVMGRSLGSAPALEIAARHGDRINGLVLESGFAYTAPFLELIGVSTSRLGFSEAKGFRNLDKIRVWEKNTLIIHAEFDPVFPFSEGQALYDACPSRRKTLLKIPGANHNDILMRGMDMYLTAVKTLSDEIKTHRDNP